MRVQKHENLLAQGLVELADVYPQRPMPSLAQLQHLHHLHDLAWGGICSYRTPEGWRFYRRANATGSYRDLSVLPKAAVLEPEGELSQWRVGIVLEVAGATRAAVEQLVRLAIPGSITALSVNEIRPAPAPAHERCYVGTCAGCGMEAEGCTGYEPADGGEPAPRPATPAQLAVREKFKANHIRRAEVEDEPEA